MPSAPGLPFIGWSIEMREDISFMSRLNLENEENFLIPRNSSYAKTVRGAACRKHIYLREIKKNTWMAFAGQERIHAKWINTLYSHLKDGEISSEQTKFTVQSIKTVVDYIETQID